MVDPIFADPRLAAIYDALDADRSDLDVYADLVDELGANEVLDIGCGTGTFACLLADRGKNVTAVDPAAASVEVARRKPGAEHVRWIVGESTDLPPLQVDLVTMTGNVAQVFLDDAAWTVTLTAALRALRPGGALVFEVRDPEFQGWKEWKSHRRVEIPRVGLVETWVDLQIVELPLVSFRCTYFFHADKTIVGSDSTLRFRTCDEVMDTLTAAGFEVEEVRDAPDRPGRELVFVARRPSRTE